MRRMLTALATIGLVFSAASPALAHDDDKSDRENNEHGSDHKDNGHQDKHYYGTPNRSLAEILLSDSAKDGADGFDKRSRDFDIVTQAVLLFPDLVDAASNPDLDLTVFLPNDAAFRKLVKDLTGQWLKKESDVFDAVAGLGVETVKTVLTYHIILGSAIDYATARASDGAELTTLQSGIITVDVHGRRGASVRLIDNDPDARDPKVVSPNVGGEATNGFAHGIDRVLRPIDL